MDIIPLFSLVWSRQSPPNPSGFQRAMTWVRSRPLSPGNFAVLTQAAPRMNVHAHPTSFDFLCLMNNYSRRWPLKLNALNSSLTHIHSFAGAKILANVQIRGRDILEYHYHYKANN
ncbi:hypothetical protein PAAG_00757 [Paracoccidioides lutzii Pb01]|uniref:Uncharacterized protein n=1 Tax=Paracoccidioides lutzii (strain ATCC MYA-826 / Pb01) TaxID=502779 RepID=C1GQG2_PARBA|nr:hypothetical protein PAAG_00757 [Paracoccidioides lutzii Pb01]EEH37836.2 hypothetical protein PAAG_00757 [Paracoccidioides lutzii Pb01]